MPEQDGVSAALPDVGVLFAEAWLLLKDRFSLLLLIVGAGAALTMFSALAPFLAVLAWAMLGGGGYAPWIAASLASLTGMLWCASWAQSALSEALLSPAESRGALEIYRVSWARAAGFAWVCLLVFLFSVGGFFLFLLPGVFLTVGLLFAPFVFLAEGRGGMDALAGSLGHVRGRWLAVAGRLLAAALASALPSYVPLVGPFTGAVTGPFSLAYAAVLYRSLKGLPPLHRAEPRNAKLLIASAGLGLLLPLWGAVSMAPMMRETLPGLKAQVRELLEHPGDPRTAEKILALLEGRLARGNAAAGFKLIQVSTAASASESEP